jgi:hypothetical protein
LTEAKHKALNQTRLPAIVIVVVHQQALLLAVPLFLLVVQLATRAALNGGESAGRSCDFCMNINTKRYTHDKDV